METQRKECNVPLTLEKLHQRLDLIQHAVWRATVLLDGTLYLPSPGARIYKPCGCASR
jgi:hypothetical protein